MPWLLPPTTTTTHTHARQRPCVPHPQRPITVNFGMRMPGWYDIASLDDINAREDKAGLTESKRCVRACTRVCACTCLHACTCCA
jgi:hypothetical protein